MTNGHSSLRAFGNCRLDTRKKLLWAGDRPVQLPLKAVELLCVLVEGRGALLTKDEIWQDVSGKSLRLRLDGMPVDAGGFEMFAVSECVD